MFDQTSSEPIPIVHSATTGQCEVCPSCSTSITLATIVTTILTALLCTAIFVLVQVALWKSRQKKFTPDHGEFNDGAGTLEPQEYEEFKPSSHGQGGVGTVAEPQEYDEVIVGGEGGMTSATSDSMYVEIGTGGGGGGGGRGGVLELNENKAYGTQFSA